MAVAVKMNIRSKRLYCATMKKKNSHSQIIFAQGKALRNESGVNTEEKDALFLLHLITIDILQAEVR